MTTFYWPSSIPISIGVNAFYGLITAIFMFISSLLGVNKLGQSLYITWGGILASIASSWMWHKKGYDLANPSKAKYYPTYST